jgi:multiple sugar transport system ATP-binding protein
VVREPKAFLLDEPLSNLDAELRTHTRAEIKALQRRLATTTVYVTHDQVEAMTMGDRVAVLRGGRVEQVDAPMTLYDRPANGFVARFLGSPPMNLVVPAALGLRGNGTAVAGVRPERISLVDAGGGRATGRIVLVEPVGNGAIVHVEVGAERVLVRTPWTEAPSQGAEAGLAFTDDDVHMFESHDGPALT